MSNTIDIPWAKPDYWGNERQYIDNALQSTWISGGPYLDQLEQHFTQLTDSKHALAVSNGTAAIQLAYMALCIRPGDEIVIPGFGYLAAANTALAMAAKPVFCEVDPHTWCAQAENIEPHITSATRRVSAS